MARGSEGFPSLTSARTALPRVAASDSKSRRSSAIWKVVPARRPKSRKANATSCGARAASAPASPQNAKSDPVLRYAICSASSELKSVLPRSAICRASPSTSCRSVRTRASSAPGVFARRARSRDAARSQSPAITETPFPYATRGAGNPRRVSPSSITSSCSSVAECTISATRASGTRPRPRRPGTAARAESSSRRGRTRFPPARSRSAAAPASSRGARRAAASSKRSRRGIPSADCAAGSSCAAEGRASGLAAAS